MTEDDALRIREIARQTGADAAWYNMPAIFFTNKLLFNGLVSGRFANAGRRLVTSDGKKVLLREGAAYGEKYLLAPRRWAARQLNYLKNPVQTLKDIGKSGVLYGEANIGEGLQEITQETIAAAGEELALARYNGDLTRGGLYAYLGDGLKTQISPQGFETFMSGFLMGGFISPISGAIGNVVQGRTQRSGMETGVQYGTRKLGDIITKTRSIIGGADSKATKQYQQRIADREKLDKQYEASARPDVDKLNRYLEDPLKYLSPHLDNLQNQTAIAKMRKEAVKNNDKKLDNDLKDASITGHVITGLKYGQTDMIIQRLEEMRDSFFSHFSYSCLIL